MIELLKRIRRIVPRWLTEVRFPSVRYRSADIRMMPVGGQLHHVLIRHQADVLDALQLNLRTVIERLVAAGGEFFIEEGLWAKKPQVGVTRKVALDLLVSLRTAGKSHPIYVEPLNIRGWRRGQLSVSLSENDFTRLTEGGGFNVYTVLRNAGAGRKLSSPQGCLVSIWERDEDGGLNNFTPRDGLTTSIAASDQQIAPIEAHGVATQTMSHLASRLVERSTPIDVVYLWVDGSDPAWLQRKANRLGHFRHDNVEEAAMEHRYRHFDELRYSLRSLERYAPWVRNVYLVTDRQKPSWLAESGTNLKVVDHSEILPESALPTYNSHALTASLHHINGIADRFVLFNDDMLLGRPVAPEAFFDDNGVSRFFLSKTLINERPELAHEFARVHSADIIGSVTGARPRHVLRHAPYTFNRSLLDSIEDEMADAWKATVNSPFRSNTDIVPEYIHHYVGYSRRLSRPADIDYAYFPVGRGANLSALKNYQRGKAAEVLCVNDEGSDDESHESMYQTLTRFFETEFPYASQYEAK